MIQKINANNNRYNVFYLNRIMIMECASNYYWTAPIQFSIPSNLNKELKNGV